MVIPNINVNTIFFNALVALYYLPPALFFLRICSYKFQHNNTEQKKACLLCNCVIRLLRLSVPIHFTKAQNYTLKCLFTLFSASI